MLAWRYAVGALLSRAHKKGLIRSTFSSEDFHSMLETQHGREWSVFIGRSGSKTYRLGHDGRYNDPSAISYYLR